MQKNISAKIKTFFLLVFSCFLALVVLEVVARYIIRQPYYAFPEGYFVANEFYGYGLASNFRGTYSQPEFTISVNTNSQGLRDVEHVSDNGDFRILALGDSFTFGVGVELKDLYLSRLEQMLNRNKERGYSIIKAGVVGYSTFNEKEYLERIGLGFHPDLVMVQFWWDDLGIDRITYLADSGFLTSGRIKSNAQLRLFLNRHFRAYAFLRRVFTIISKKNLFAPKTFNEAEDQPGLEKKSAVTLKEFKEIEALCEKNRISCLFILIPPKELVYDDSVLRSQWESFRGLLSRNKIRYFDCLPVLKESALRGEVAFFKVDPHLNQNGHKIVAEGIYRYLSFEFKNIN